jgi:hypothetical protein
MDIAATVTRMARKGTDLRTIVCHLEACLGRGLATAEAEQMNAAWVATAADRADIERRRAQRAADEARAR